MIGLKKEGKPDAGGGGRLFGEGEVCGFLTKKVFRGITQARYGGRKEAANDAVKKNMCHGGKKGPEKKNRRKEKELMRKKTWRIC